MDAQEMSEKLREDVSLTVVCTTGIALLSAALDLLNFSSPRMS
jgi:hypothetical protein